MNIFAPNDVKARTALDTAVSRHALAISLADAHRLNPADPGDFDAVKTWEATREALAGDVQISESVVEHWRKPRSIALPGALVVAVTTRANSAVPACAGSLPMI